MPTITANGIAHFYDLAGPEGAPVVVFSNSLGSTIEMWDAVVPTLAGRYRCLRYDTRSHGRSGSADVAVTIDDLAADVIGLLDGLKIERVHFVGLSIGSMTGLALASRHPQRLASLVAMATSAHLPPQDFWQKRAATVRTSGLGAIIDTLLPRWFTAAFRERNPHAVANVRKNFMMSEPAGYARCCEALGAMDLRTRLASIVAPTLIIGGANDPVTTPAMVEAVRAGIPGAEAVMLGDTAHLISIERPDATAAYLAAFLDRLTGQSAANDDRFAQGLAVRRQVLGTAHVDKSLANAGAFGMPWQDFITRMAWGEVWGDPTLPRKTRSLVTLAMMIALHREEEFKLHVRPALGNGVTVAELAALIKQAAIYAGVPAANAAMRWTREILGSELE